MQERTQTAGIKLWKWLLLPGTLVVIWMAYVWAQALPTFMDPESARIIFWHVPMAWLGLIWFWVGAFHAVRYLYGARRGQPEQDRRSAVAGELGLICTVLATVTGMVFAWKQWGAPWNWDPKQVGISVLILVYLAYFGLRMSVENPELRGRLSAVYTILAAFSSPFLTYVLPNLPQVAKLHPPGQTITGGLDTKWRIIYTLSFVMLMGTTLWTYELRLRFEKVAERLASLAEAGVARRHGTRTEAVRKPVGSGVGE